MKKLCSLLLVLCLMFLLSACGGNETATYNDNGSSTTQNQTDATDKSSTEQSTDTTSSDIDNNGNTDDTDVSSSTASKPNTAEPDASKPTTTEPESTKPSTPTHAHSYSDATCTAPAKCSCGATNGSALGHFYENWICIRCGKADPSKPTFNPVVEYPKEPLYESRGYSETGVWNHYSYLIKDYYINGNTVVLKCQLVSIMETNSQFTTTGTSRNDFNNFPVKLDACVVLDYFTYTSDGTPYDSWTNNFDLRNYKVGDMFEFEFYISDYEKVSKIVFKQP